MISGQADFKNKEQHAAELRDAVAEWEEKWADEWGVIRSVTKDKETSAPPDSPQTPDTPTHESTFGPPSNFSPS